MKKILSVILAFVVCLSAFGVFAEGYDFFYSGNGARIKFTDCNRAEVVGIYKDVQVYSATSQFSPQMSHIVFYADGYYEMTFFADQLILKTADTYAEEETRVVLNATADFLPKELILQKNDDGTLKYTSDNIYGCLSPQKGHKYQLAYGDGFGTEPEPTATPEPTDTPEPTAAPDLGPTSRPAPTAAPKPTPVPNLKVFVDGVKVEFDQEPIIINDRTMVPVRAVFEALGATVTWDDSIKTAYGEKDGITVSIKIGEKVIYKNGQGIEIDTEAQIVNSRTLVPVRAIAECFECDVQWDEETRSVIITTK